jgi:hypothetical protein
MTTHFEILVEEASAEAFLNAALPSILGDKTFAIHVHQGKSDLLGKLEGRLKGYQHWLPDNNRIIVLIDRDNEDCITLKAKLEEITERAGFVSRSKGPDWRVANRIVIEELEAWFFGDWEAVYACYPRVSKTVTAKAAFRVSDDIRGGTWEALERILISCGYYQEGLPKLELAANVGMNFDANRCTSSSFSAFLEALVDE